MFSIFIPEIPKFSRISKLHNPNSLRTRHAKPHAKHPNEACPQAQRTSGYPGHMLDRQTHKSHNSWKKICVKKSASKERKLLEGGQPWQAMTNAVKKQQLTRLMRLTTFVLLWRHALGRILIGILWNIDRLYPIMIDNADFWYWCQHILTHLISFARDLTSQCRTARADA